MFSVPVSIFILHHAEINSFLTSRIFYYFQSQIELVIDKAWGLFQLICTGTCGQTFKIDPLLNHTFVKANPWGFSANWIWTDFILEKRPPPISKGNHWSKYPFIDLMPKYNLFADSRKKLTPTDRFSVLKRDPFRLHTPSMLHVYD